MPKVALEVLRLIESAGAAAESVPKFVTPSVTPEIELPPGALVMLPLAPAVVALTRIPDHMIVDLHPRKLLRLTFMAIWVGAGVTVCEEAPFN